MPLESFEGTLAQRVVAPPRIAADVRLRARSHFIDTLGVMLAGAREHSVKALVAGANECQTIGKSVRSVVSAKPMSARDAALCNAVAGHAHDFDDDEPHMIVGHPSIAVVAALLATAGHARVPFAAVLDAYAVGTETMLRLGSLVNPRHYSAGWHCTASLGAFGAAAACAHVLSISPRDAANALNIAATFAGGLRENFGTDGKPLQVGVAAANGLWACELALSGIRGADRAISGRQGFLAMNHGRDGVEALDGFGRPWGLESPGFNVKVYPCCSSTHTALDGLLELLAETALPAADIESIDVWMGEDVPGILIHDVPRMGLEGKFSMRYCMAYAALHREVGISAFTDAAVQEPRLQAMMERVCIHIDPTLPRAATGVTHCTRVQLTSRNGARVQRSHSAPFGSAERLCSKDQLQRKFLDCVAYGLDAQAALQIWAGIDAISERDPASDLLEVVHGSTEQRP